MRLFTARDSASADVGADNRRSFLKKFGIGVSTALGSTLGSAAAFAKPESRGSDTLALQVAKLEAEKALRALHQQYETALDNGDMDAALALFTADAEVVFNSGVFNGEQGIGRLYRQHFASGNTGKRMQAAPGFALTSEQQAERVDVAADLNSAQAVLPYSIQVGKLIDSASSLTSMARLHGEGIQSWWEGGVYELSYVKDAVDASWKIKRLTYNTLSRADYRAGRSHASALTVPAFSVLFPADPQGPDALV